MDIRDLIMKRSGEMSPVQKRIAMTVMNAAEEVAFMTAARLGEHAQVSEASVVRFVRMLGFSKYNEFRAALSRALMDRLSTTERSKLVSEHSGGGLYASMLQKEIEAMTSVKDGLEDRDIDVLGAAIASAPALYVCSCRSSHALGYYLAFYLSWFLPQVKTLEHCNAYETLNNAPQESLVVGISFPRYTHWTVNVLRHAHERGLTIATLTSNLGSPLSDFSKYTLAVPYRLVSFIDSFAIPMSVVNCLILSAFRACGKEAREKLESLEKIWKKQGIYAD